MQIENDDQGGDEVTRGDAIFGISALVRPSREAFTEIRVTPVTCVTPVAQALVSREETDGKTAKSLRTIHIASNLTRLLLEARGNQVVGPMSRNEIGLPVNSEHFANKYFLPLLRDIGLKYRSPYTLRHTYITLALMQGSSAAHVAEYCGTSIQQIERSYLSWIGVIDDPMKRGVEKAVGTAQHVSVRGLAGFQR